MKAISYHQPYAWMIANGHLDIDDRTWSTAHRGDIAIHASKGFSQLYYNYVKNHIGIDIPAPEDLEFGGIVAIANLKGCISPGHVTSVPKDRRAHGGIHCYGWLIDNVRKINFIPCRGKQGLFDVDIKELKEAAEKSLEPSQNRLF